MALLPYYRKPMQQAALTSNACSSGQLNAEVVVTESLQDRIEKQCASTALHTVLGRWPQPQLQQPRRGRIKTGRRLFRSPTCFFCAKHSHHALCQWVQGCHGAYRN